MKVENTQNKPDNKSVQKDKLQWGWHSNQSPPPTTLSGTGKVTNQDNTHQLESLNKTVRIIYSAVY